MSTSTSDRFSQFELSLEPSRADIVDHPVFAQLTDIAGLRLFMRSHVFAVWDFMSLLKTLQNQLTCVTIPWIPPRDREAARIINEIVLGEETDEVRPGVHLSHFELYLEAMGQMLADTAPVLSFLRRIQIAGWDSKRELEYFKGLQMNTQVEDFVRATMRFCQMPAHQVAAVFLYGREDVIPDMFQRLLQRLNLYNAPDYALLRIYLERHIHLDGETHGPLARKMLSTLCGDSEQKWSEAHHVAQEAMHRRKLLWDGILYELGSHKRQKESVSQLHGMPGLEKESVCRP